MALIFALVRRASVLLLALGAGFAHAADVAQAAFANAPDSTWMTNGPVHAVVRAENLIYIGGQFTSLKACASESCQSVTVNNVAALDANTGAAIPSFDPGVTGRNAVVYALAVHRGKLFIGGDFTAVDGQRRRNFAAVDAVTGALDRRVNTKVGARRDAGAHVRALLALRDRVYIGGLFSEVDGVPRGQLAAVDLRGNLDLSWRPRASRLVSSLAPACDGKSIFAGGLFRSAAGSDQSFVARRTIARFERVSGTLLPWSIPPDTFRDNPTINAMDIAATCKRLYVAYGGDRNLAAAIDLTDNQGELVWRVRANGDVQTVALTGRRVLFGGHFDTIDGTQRSGFAALRGRDGRLDRTWTPSFEGRFLGPLDILVSGDQIWVGGDYTHVSGEEQQGVARFTNRTP